MPQTDLNWTKGIDPKTGKPLEYDPKLDVQQYVTEARALRGDGMKRACPTWHGGVAHQPVAYNPVKKIAYGVGIEGCFTQNGAAVAYKSPEGGIDTQKSEKHVDVLPALDEAAVGAIECVEESVASEVGDSLAVLTIDGGVVQQVDAVLVVVPRIVRRVLEIPGELAALDIERDRGVGVEIVARPRLRIVDRNRIAGAPYREL